MCLPHIAICLLILCEAEAGDSVLFGDLAERRVAIFERQLDGTRTTRGLSVPRGSAVVPARVPPRAWCARRGADGGKAARMRMVKPQRGAGPAPRRHGC